MLPAALSGTTILVPVLHSLTNHSSLTVAVLHCHDQPRIRFRTVTGKISPRKGLRSFDIEPLLPHFVPLKNPC